MDRRRDPATAHGLTSIIGTWRACRRRFLCSSLERLPQRPISLPPGSPDVGQYRTTGSITLRNTTVLRRHSSAMTRSWHEALVHTCPLPLTPSTPSPPHHPSPPTPPPHLTPLNLTCFARVCMHQDRSLYRIFSDYWFSATRRSADSDRLGGTDQPIMTCNQISLSQSWDALDRGPP